MNKKGIISPGLLLITAASTLFIIGVLLTKNSKALPDTSTTTSPIQPKAKKSLESTNNEPIIEPTTTPAGETIIFKDNPLNWPVVKVCEPEYIEGETPEQVLDLKDDTYIYKRPDGTQFRGTDNQCR